MFKQFTINNNKSIYCIALIITLFVISKIPFLALPFYWDEAWSYAVAIFDMHDHGISLIPGSVNTEFTRGHPLLYYVSASIWTKIFGTTILSCHLFALLISCLSLYAVYLLSKNLFNNKVAIATCSIFAVQTWFWIQSTFLLPEVFLMLFSILAINAYFTKKWFLFTLWTSCVVLTKETGWVLLIMFLFDYFVLTIFWDWKQITKKRYWLDALFLLIPVFVLFTFLIIQKIRLGWFFFPSHIGMMHLHFSEIRENFLNILEVFLITQYRFLLLISIIVAIYFIIRKNIILNIKDKRFVLFISIFIIAFIGFSCINFFTLRYLISILPLYLLISTALFDKLPFSNKKWLIFVVAIILFGFITIDKKNESDVTIGYKNTIKVHKQALIFCEKNNWYNESLNTGFLESYNAVIPRLGYLHDTLTFKNINMPNPSIYIFYSCEYAPQNIIDSLKNDTSMTMAKRFENGNAWSEIYCKKRLLIDK